MRKVLPTRERMRRASLTVRLAVIGLLCVSCKTSLNSASPVHSDIAEAVFRYIAQPAATNDGDSHQLNRAHQIYFLQLDGQDPSREFFSRLHDLITPVKPLSSSVERHDGRYDATTGKRGAAFYINHVQMIGKNKATAEANLAPGGVLRGSGFTYRLVKKAGKWVVVSEKLRWVS